MDDELLSTSGDVTHFNRGHTAHGGGAHRYYVTVFALDVSSLELPGHTRDDFDAAIKGHTLAKARMMGRYERARVGAM